MILIVLYLFNLYIAILKHTHTQIPKEREEDSAFLLLFMVVSCRWFSHKPTFSPNKSWRSWSATSQKSWRQRSQTIWMRTSTSMLTWRIVTLRTEKGTTISTTTWMKTTAPEVFSAKHLKYKPGFIVEVHTLISKTKHLFWNFVHFLFNYMSLNHTGLLTVFCFLFFFKPESENCPNKPWFIMILFDCVS